MELLALYWGILILFYAIATRLRRFRERFGFLEGALNVIIYLLVFIMGLRMGANEEVISNLSSIGLQALGITVFTVAGSMCAVTVMRKFMGLNREGIPKLQAEREKAAEAAARSAQAQTADADAQTAKTQATDRAGGARALDDKAAAETAESAAAAEKDGGRFKITVLILAFSAAGLAAGYLAIPRMFDVAAFEDASGDMMVVGICLLLAFVGFNLGLDGSVLTNLKKVGAKVLLIPVAAIAGSLLMGALYSLVCSMTVRETMAISAGFGWYTFAPGVISEAGHIAAGAVSFVHNVIRETLGIIAIPLAAQKIGYLEATSIPGVAAMDVCLPIVEKSCRQETVVYSFCMGTLMSMSVPLLVQLIIG